MIIPKLRNRVHQPKYLLQGSLEHALTRFLVRTESISSSKNYRFWCSVLVEKFLSKSTLAWSTDTLLKGLLVFHYFFDFCCNFYPDKRVVKYNWNFIARKFILFYGNRNNIIALKGILWGGNAEYNLRIITPLMQQWSASYKDLLMWGWHSNNAFNKIKVLS